jgi:phospholipid/cholesterol/gamma-HCH transport system permease protein
MSGMAEFTETADGGERVLELTGGLTLARMGDLQERIAALPSPPARLDIKGVDRVDTVGAWVLHRLIVEKGVKISGASDDAKRLIEQVSAGDDAVQVHADTRPAFYRVLDEIGDATVIAGQTLLGLLGFFGAILVATWDVIRNPKRFRVNAVIQRFELVGVKALAIVGLMSFLIGIVIAQQGAVQLAQFGAESLTVNLIGRLSTRELGVLMTAIMVAGRSGSAFAAQIGTMKLTEEIDAMRTIGVSPMEALVLPRMMACTVMMPLLAFYSIIVAMIGGGIFCWISLDIQPQVYIQRIREVTPLTDLFVAMTKAPVFGAIIGMSGCFQGMQVESNAEQVGLRTTAAVVQAIFLVIVLDAFFAVFFTEVGWV